MTGLDRFFLGFVAGVVVLLMWHVGQIQADVHRLVHPSSIEAPANGMRAGIELGS